MSQALDEARANEILSGDPVTVGPFRVRDGVLQHVAPDGTVSASVPLEGAELETQGERSVAVAVVVSGFLLLLEAGLWACLGGGTLAIAAVVPVTLVLGLLVLVALRDAPELVVRHGEARHRWPLGDAPRLEVALLVMRSQQPPGKIVLARSQTTHHLFFTAEPTERPEGVAASKLLDRSEPMMLHTVAEACRAAEHALFGNPNSQAYAVLQHVRHARFTRNVAVPEEQRERIVGWLSQQAVVVLREADVAFLDGSLQVIGAGGTGRVPVADDAVERRARTLAKLTAEGHRAPPLPPLRGRREVALREGSEVARRVLALGAVSMKVSTAQHGVTPPDEAFTTMWGPGLAALSPNEAEAMTALDLEAHGGLSWRFESMATLAWALGWLPRAPPLDAQVDPDDTLVIPREHATEAAVAAAALRPVDELLDLLDEVVCRRWLVVDAQQGGRPLPAGLAPSVLLERHHALNWLVQWGWADWDDVDCPT